MLTGKGEKNLPIGRVWHILGKVRAGLRTCGAHEKANPGMNAMKLTNDNYLIVINTKSSTERYLRDANGWLKVSTRGRKFRATAEQVLNHVLPVLAGLKPSLNIKVTHHAPLLPK